MGNICNTENQQRGLYKREALQIKNNDNSIEKNGQTFTKADIQKGKYTYESTFNLINRICQLKPQ